MQLVCQRNSLNRRDVTDQEIAELSEILTVQENKGGAPHCQSRVQMPRTRGEAWQRPYVFERVSSSPNSLNKYNLARKVFSAHARSPGALTGRCENIGDVFLFSSLAVSGWKSACSLFRRALQVSTGTNGRLGAWRPGNVMAHVIEFYMPARFKPKVKWVPQEQRGKVIAFPSDLKESARYLMRVCD